MKIYGLQLRGQQQQKKVLTKPPLSKPLGFDDDENDDTVERDIMRQAYKNKTHKDIEEQHKKALEEDPSVFDYDGVYDEMKEKQIRPVEQECKDRKPRYIQKLMEKAKQREREHEISYERKIAKERSKDDHLYADKEKFVTSAYKKKLAEQAKWLEEERLREMREEKEDVTKKTDLSDFYFNLAKNVAFGAGKESDTQKPEKQPGELMVQSPRQVSPPVTGTSSESSRMVKRQRDEIAESLSPREKSDSSYAKAISDTPPPDQVRNEPSASNQPDVDHKNGSEDAGAAAKDHYKRNEDAVAAAKARFLARKKAKV